MANLPQDFSYSAEHEWIDCPADEAPGATVKVGVTSVATERLGEVVFAELPAVGDQVTAGEPCGEIESTKSVSDLYSPVTGTVAEVNESVHDDYEVINADPFGAGWLFSVTVDDVGELVDATSYAAANGIEA
ncbi:glycine cleavage system protein H [Corynebacterium atypicum]|uniref:Glycine cleavage system H protein n=1 Tax=Corynebacterium atypicum TaxID=191610 RepID=A0ABM5QNZ9_9CORY|nr:glycine cleavage system protein GcvH [Corynebacterium atypicum]AIG64461.1 glycine cleavage system protein H [Corynebacterium atypicum]